MKIKRIITLLLVLSLFIGIIGCKKTHEHTFEKEWSYNETEHYHKATCEHSDERDAVSKHTFDNGTITKEPTETTKGVKTYKCTVCNFTKIEEIKELEHVHTFEEKWTQDETSHYHKATCEHTSEKKDFGDHQGEWTEKVKADYEHNQVLERICTVCGYHQEKEIEDTKLVQKDRVIKYVENFKPVYDGTDITVDKIWHLETVDGEKIENVEGTVNVTYYEGTTVLLAPPVNAGKYSVEISISETKEWKATEVKFEFEIAKREISGLKISKIYDGNGDFQVYLTTTNCTNLVENDKDLLVIFSTNESDVDSEFTINDFDFISDSTTHNNYVIDISDIVIEILPCELLCNEIIKTYITTDTIYTFTEDDGLLEGDECTLSLNPDSKFGLGNVFGDESNFITSNKNYKFTNCDKMVVVYDYSDNDFVLEIQDLFNIISGGETKLIITGLITLGKIKVGDKIKFNGIDKEATVAGIEKYRKQFEEANVNETPGILVTGVTRDEVSNCMIAYKEKTVTNTKKIVLNAYVYSKEEGGLTTFFAPGIKPIVKFGSSRLDLVGTVTSVGEGMDYINLGNYGIITVELDTSMTVYMGMEIKLTINGKTIAKGIIMEIE